MDTNAVVSTVIRFEPSVDRPLEELLQADVGLTVVLEGERRVRLDPADPRSAGFAEVMDGLSKLNLPVYIEVEPDTSTVTRLLIPLVVRVVGIRPSEGGLEVELTPSHARHVLPSGGPEVEELERQLREALNTGAPVIVTESDDHEIIDVRAFTPGPEGPPFPLPKPELPPPNQWLMKLLGFWRCCGWPWWWFHRLTATRAQQVFDAMNATSCEPLTVPPPCIPFMYPDDGCWGRAHEMSRLMIAMGLKPRKVWIEGTLQASTRNNPSCFVRWGWHVAPTLCVRGRWLFLSREMVIDPSLFTTPASTATWKGVQGDPNATLTRTAASIFYLWGSVTDPTYAQTNQVLATYRLHLQNRAVQLGPPPYANCP